MISKSSTKIFNSVKLTNIKTLVGFNSLDQLQTFNNCQLLIKEGKIVKISPSFDNLDSPDTYTLDTQ